MSRENPFLPPKHGGYRAAPGSPQAGLPRPPKGPGGGSKAPDAEGASGLRQAVEALRLAVDDACPHGTEGHGAHAEGTCEVCDFVFQIDALIEEAMEPFLAAHPPEPEASGPATGFAPPYCTGCEWGCSSCVD